MKDFKHAIIQMNVDGGDKTKNIEHAANLIDEAASNGAECVTLPEALDLGWTHPSSESEAEPIPGGKPFQAFSESASKNKVYVCAGLTEKDGDDVYNTAVIISPKGELLIKHRKLNELIIGHRYYSQGDRLNVCHTDFGALGLMICADGFARDMVLSRSLCYMGADIILSPCAWAVDADHENSRQPYGKTWIDAYTPVAREFAVWIIGVSNVGWISGGPWDGKKCIGCSMVVDPDGEVVLQAPYGVDAETIIYTDIKPRLRPARGCGWSNFHPAPKADIV